MESSSPWPPEPTARRGPRFWQFSLRDALLLILVACITAAYWGAQRSHLTERRLRVDAERRVSILQNEKFGTDRAQVLKVSDPSKVHVKDVLPARGSREGSGWAWRVHLPPDRQWWLYISQGEHWDGAEGKYTGGAISGSQIKGGHEVWIFGCITHDFEGGAYIQNWVGEASQAARFSDGGYAVFRAPDSETRYTAGENEQQTVDVTSAFKGRMQLFRWHRERRTDQTEPPKEYGFSIYLVDETPGFRPSQSGGSRE